MITKLKMGNLGIRAKMNGIILGKQCTKLLSKLSGVTIFDKRYTSLQFPSSVEDLELLFATA